MDQHNTLINWTINGVAIGTIITSIMGVIPAMAALAAAIYYLVQVWESETVRQWRESRRLKKIASLRAKILLLEAEVLAVPPVPKSH